MRIAILQGPFLPVPPLRGGAIEKAWFRLGKAFAKEGHEVVHVSRRCDGLPQEETIEDVRHQRVEGFEATGSTLFLKWRDLRYVLRASKVLPAADILVTHAFWAPLLIRDHSRGALYVHVGRYPKGQMKFYGRAARLQAPSETIAEAILREVPSRASKVKAIPYPLSWETEMVLEPASRKKSVLFLGRIHPEKGLRELVNAFAGLPEESRRDWRLDVRGPWRKEQGGAGQDFLDELKVSAKPAGNAIHFHEPFFDDAKLREDLKRASLFVYPSLAERGETFGLAALEAMSCGCPPLVSSLACFRDFVTDGKTGFVFDHCDGEITESLHGSLVKLLVQPDALAKVGAAGCEAAKAYSLESVAKLFLEDFREVLGKG